MTLPELQSCLDRLGVKLSLRGDRLAVDAPAGVMTEEIKAALAAHKPALLAMLAGLDDRTDPAGPTAGEPSLPDGPAGWGPPPADRGWRKTVAHWPIGWRAIWGELAESHQAVGATWDQAEWSAFNETVRDLAEAERRGDVLASSYADSVPRDGLSDAEAVAGIALAFGDADPAPSGPSGTGPRDVRRGDRWLPWH
jgi:TubC N-terminal docking domain